jgi:hypothetical protein
MVTDGTNDGGTLQRTVIDYNARSPARQIRIQVEADSRTPAVIGAVLVSALPVILLVVLVVFLARQPGLRRDRR